MSEADNKFDVEKMRDRLKIMKISEVARLSGVSRFTLYRFMQPGKGVNPSYTTLHKINKFLQSIEQQ